MMLLKLFLTFFEIGLFTFGGGYAMISLIREKCLAHGWLMEEEVINFIAVSESTPGPFAINMATFVGSSQAGILGSIFATLGVILPSFIIILIIVIALKNLMKQKGVQSFIGGVKPVVIGLILGTAVTLFLSILCGIKTVENGLSLDLYGIIIFAITWIIAAVYKKIKKKVISPILLIIMGAIMGLIFYL